MKNLTTILLLSCFILSSASPVFADRKDKLSDKNRHEYGDNRKPDRHHNDPKYNDHKKDKHHYDHGFTYYGQKPSKHKHDRAKAYKKYIKEQQKHEKQYRKMLKHYHRDYTNNFWNMVHNATRGGRDISVWQVSDDTYMLRYFLNGRWYSQYIYPYAGRYGNRSLISINWTPNNMWLPIPSININL